MVFDAQLSKRRDRQKIEQMAADTGSVPVFVWVKNSPETAIERFQSRAALADSHPYPAEKIKMLIERFYKVTEFPEPGENLIETSGELAFEDQFDNFMMQLKKYKSEPAGISS